MSTPTPCSPVSEPPASMQTSRIAVASALGELGLALDARRRRARAGAGCRRRRGRRSRRGGRTRRRARRSGAAPRAAASAARRRPGRSSSARSGPSPRTPTCGPRQMRARSSAVSAACTLERAAVAADLLDRGRVLEHLRRRPVELDDQHRAGARRVAGCDRGLDRLERERVHHLDRRRQDPGRDHVRDRLAGGVGRVERGEQRSHRLGHAQHAHVDRARRSRASPRSRRTRRAGRGPSSSRESVTSSPSGSTTSAASTWLTVKPCLRQCAPPEFSATLPPIVQTCWLDGSGA